MEHFSVNNFDQVMDHKCFNQFGNKLNNYLGPWDGLNGRCVESTCDTETCTYTSQKLDGTYEKYVKTEPKELIVNDNGQKSCVTKTVTNTNGNSIDCSENQEIDISLDPEVITCYIGETVDSPGTVDWRLQRFKNVMDGDGTKYWRNIYSIGESYPTKELLLENCIPEPISCADSNYFCCDEFVRSHESYCPKEYDREGNRIITSDMINQQVIHHPVKDGMNNKWVCAPKDPGMCTTSVSGYNKYCYNFDYANRIWTGFDKPFIPRIVNNTLKNIYEDDNMSLDYEYAYCMVDSLGQCASNYKPSLWRSRNSNNCVMKTNYMCSRNSNLVCQFLNNNQELMNITYESKVDSTGTACEYQILHEDVNENYPHILEGLECPTNISCPSSEQYLRNNDIHLARCEYCDEDEYRTDRLNELGTLTKEDACNKIRTDCGFSDSNFCWVPYNNNINILKKEYVQMIADKNECVEKPNERYNMNCYDLDATDILYTNIITSGNTEFLNNCGDDYTVTHDLECKPNIDCIDNSRQNCLFRNSTNDTYEKHEDVRYINRDNDKSQACIYTNESFHNMSLGKCFKYCPANYVLNKDKNTCLHIDQM